MFADSTPPADAAWTTLSKLRLEEGVPLEALFQQVTEAGAAQLNVERVGVWLLIDEAKALRCVDLYERSKGTHSSGITLEAAEFPEYFAALDGRRTIPAEWAATDKHTSGLAESYLLPLGIGSLIDAPIYVGGQVKGVLCHEHVGLHREWSQEDRDFAASMADLLSLKIRAAEAEELKDALRVQAVQLAESRRLGDLAQTAAGVAHDFNNFLSVILGCAQIIEIDPACPPKLVEHARKIGAAGRRGMSLAKELMDFASPATPAARVVRPAEVVTNLLPVLRAAVGEQHALQARFLGEHGQVMIDPVALERLMLNLVLNARDAMPEGGQISLQVEAVSAEDEGGRRGHFVLMTVADKGTGIAPETLGRIFDPFFTTKPRGQGTGVGLAVVHQLVTHVGGFVRVESEVGRGSAFRVYLPRVSSY